MAEVKDAVIDTRAIEILEKFSSPELVEELVALFIQTTPERLESLRRAFAAGRGAVAAQTAHRLRTACGAVGARRMAQLCQEIERLPQPLDCEHGAETVAEMERQFGRACAELEPWTRKKPSRKAA